MLEQGHNPGPYESKVQVFNYTNHNRNTLGALLTSIHLMGIKQETDCFIYDAAEKSHK